MPYNYLLFNLIIVWGKFNTVIRLGHKNYPVNALLTGGGGCGGGGCIWGAGGAMKPGIGGAGAATGNGGRAGTEGIYEISTKQEKTFLCRDNTHTPLLKFIITTIYS